MTPQPTSLTIHGHTVALTHPDLNQVKACDICGGAGYLARRVGPVVCPRCRTSGQTQVVQPGGVRIDFVQACGHVRPEYRDAAKYDQPLWHVLDGSGNLRPWTLIEDEQSFIGRTCCAACAAVGEMPERVAA